MDLCSDWHGTNRRSLVLLWVSCPLSFLNYHLLQLFRYNWWIYDWSCASRWRLGPFALPSPFSHIYLALISPHEAPSDGSLCFCLLSVWTQKQTYDITANIFCSFVTSYDLWCMLLATKDNHSLICPCSSFGLFCCWLVSLFGLFVLCFFFDFSFQWSADDFKTQQLSDNNCLAEKSGPPPWQVKLPCLLCFSRVNFLIFYFWVSWGHFSYVITGCVWWPSFVACRSQVVSPPSMGKPAQYPQKLIYNHSYTAVYAHIVTRCGSLMVYYSICPSKPLSRMGKEVVVAVSMSPIIVFFVCSNHVFITKKSHSEPSDISYGA